MLQHGYFEAKQGGNLLSSVTVEMRSLSPGARCLLVAGMLVVMFFILCMQFGTPVTRHLFFHFGPRFLLKSDGDTLSSASTASLEAKHNKLPEGSKADSVLNAHKFLQIHNRKTNGSNCVAGHFAGFKPICGGDACLRKLPAKPENRKYKELPRSEPAAFQNDSFKILRKIRGWIHSDIHRQLITQLTDMQWLFGVYGSVGEIGVFEGLLTSILALNMDAPAGENIFVADIFEHKTKLSAELGDYTKFVKNMKNWGISPSSKDRATRLHVWWDSSMYLNKDVFLLWDLPSFRFFSVDGGHSYPLVLNDFVTAICALRDGGIILLDDFYNGHKEVDKAIQDFFKIYGHEAVVPLIRRGSKLYVCTKSHVDRYKNYIRRHLARRLMLNEVTDRYFGKRYKFFS